MVLSFLVRSKSNVSSALAGLVAREHVNSRNLQWLGSVDLPEVLPGVTDRTLFIFAQVPRVSTGFRSSHRQDSFSGTVGA
jgi:hypothetical protein